MEVVTPLKPAKWQLSEQNGTVSLHPSIGNWSFACQSHYWIEGNQILWAEGMSPAAIAKVKARDKSDAEKVSKAPWRPLAAIRHHLGAAWRKTAEFVSSFWR
jgi:hypothetical protein